MIYRNFRLQVICRVLLLSFNIYAFFYFYFQSRFYVTTLLIGLCPIWQIWALFWYVQRTNLQLYRFFDTLIAGDFSERLPELHHDSGFRELSRSLNRIIVTLSDKRAETEQKRRFFQSVLQQVGVGLVSLRPDGSVAFINRSARRMLRLHNLTHVRQLHSIDPGLSIVLMTIKSGQRRWIQVHKGPQRVQLALFAQKIQLPQREGYKLLTLQNLQPELEEKESEAWKDLIRVLSHEIMNSMTPISSLSTTALQLIPKETEALSAKFVDLHEAISTISRRSQGLMQFVQNYRRFACIPDPSREPFAVECLFGRLHTLMHSHLIDRSIAFESQVTPTDLHVVIDPALIEQVLINVLTNAMDAVADSPTPRIRLTAAMDHQAQVSIQITDNGRGMDEAMIDKVFIPFFTTKTHGSGVGLSISRQIMRLHAGTLRIISSVGQGTTVTLHFT